MDGVEPKKSLKKMYDKECQWNRGTNGKEKVYTKVMFFRLFSFPNFTKRMFFTSE